MARRRRQTAALSAAVAAIALSLPSAASAAGGVSPLPASDYGVHSACGAPAPGRAACLALTLVPETAEARARTHPLGITRAVAAPAPSPSAGSYGLRPQDLHSAYQLPTTASSAQTIAIVDAYNDPGAESDLKAYDEEFSLPECTSGNGCFTQVNQNGGASPLPFPKTTGELEAARAGTSPERRLAEEATGWGLEISLDIETAHATCQSCHILLVEAESAEYQDLETAERAAANLGAGEISNSWGGPELGESPEAEGESPFNHPGIVITASAGDSGYLDWGSESPGYAEFPASSPHVVAVGGTRLSLSGGSWAGESVWNGSGAGGGGCSVIFAAPAWQQQVSDWSSVGCGEDRAVADVSAVADPYTGLAVHYTSPACKDAKVKPVAYWCTIGGTSLASPLIASVYALAGGAGSAPYPARTLYENAAQSPASLHDVVSGSNGECFKPVQSGGTSGCSLAEQSKSCSSRLICVAAPGFDGPSGLGTPDTLAAFQAVAAPAGKAGGGGAPSGEPETVTRNETAGVTVSGGGSPSGGSSTGGSGAGVNTASVQISRVGLTVRALIALNGSRPRVSQVAFAFTLNIGAQLRATLARRVRRGRKTVWQSLGRPLGLTARAGRNSQRLAGRGILGHGVYRLTLSPPRGTARSIQFQIG
jgi:hypothetical protein